ncbi:hypothetical protein RI054_39g144380 [Pseudoscourfieldia marina]
MTHGLPLNEPLLDETCEPCHTPAVLKTQIADLEAKIYATQLAEWNGECFACGKKGHRQYQKDADGKYVCEKTAELARQGKLPAPRRPGSTQTRTKRVMWVDDTTGDCYDTEHDEEHAYMSVPDASADTMTGHSTDDGTPSGGRAHDRGCATWRGPRFAELTWHQPQLVLRSARRSAERGESIGGLFW